MLSVYLCLLFFVIIRRCCFVLLFVFLGLVIAHAVNPKFQADMKATFTDINRRICDHDEYDSKENSGNEERVRYETAPVKLEERCILKCDTDYAKCSFPGAAHIVDFVRGRVIFKRAKDMIRGIGIFSEMVEEQSIDSVVAIVRRRNNFRQLARTASGINSRMCGYDICDITFNIVIRNKDTNTAIIGELELLLEWMVEYKHV